MTSSSPTRPAAIAHGTLLSHRPRIVAIGAAVAMLLAPALLTALPANAVTVLTVSSPTTGEVVQNDGLPQLVPFTGGGLPVGDTIDVRYINADNASETAIYGGNSSEPDGTWAATANFGDLAPGSTTVSVIVSALAADGTTDVTVTPAALTFELAIAPNPVSPFTVTSPSPAEVVTTPTPAFTGTGEPGSTITVTYGARSGATAIAGTGTVAEDGTYSITTDFSALEPGSLGTGADVTQTDPDGNPIPGAGVLGVGFTFATAPVALIPITIGLTPPSLTVSGSAATGFALAATGFSPDEEVTVVVTDPSGAAVTLAGTRALNVFASVTDGSYTDTLLLPAASPTGEYTVTVTGVRSARVATGTFTVTADPTDGDGTIPPTIHLPVVSG